MLFTAGLAVAGMVGFMCLIGTILVATLPSFAWAGGGQSCTVDGEKIGEGLTVTTADGSRTTHLGVGNIQNAATILAVARELGLSPRAEKIAVMTALQESELRMLANTSVPESLGFPHEGTGDDHDSVNFFQQRTTSGWGSIADLMDGQYAARAFFGGTEGPNGGSPRGLLDIPGWEDMGLGEAAQSVQVSAFPDLYDNWDAAADEVINAATAATVCNNGDIPGDLRGQGPGQWGGHENGRIPVNLLTPIPWTSEYVLRQDAAAALVAMNAAWTERFGTDIPINDGYRDYEGQVEAKAIYGDEAAEPGTSEHGWAIAVDIGIGRSFSSEQYLWLKKNAPVFGFAHPEWAEPTGYLPEAWHWEFWGSDYTM